MTGSLPPLEARTVPAVLAAALARFPEKPALRDPAGTYSYRALYEQALSTGGGLRALGLGRQEAVLLMLDNHADHVLTWLGASLMAGVEVPVNTAYKAAMLTHLVNNSGARIVVLEDRFCERLAAVAAELSSLETVVVRGGSGEALPRGRFRVVPFEMLSAGPPAAPEVVAPWDLIGIMYTSGTTGLSKGVRITQAHAYGYCSPVFLGAASEHDVSLVSLPLFHIGGQWAGVYNALIAGATAVVLPSFHATSFWDEVRRYGCTFTLLLGAMADFLHRQPPAPDDARTPMRRVTMVPVIPAVEEFKRRFGIDVATGYGLTEGSSPIRAPFGRATPRACGWLRPDFEARLVDENDTDVRRGEVGELVLRPRDPWCVMDGYHGMPDRTVEAWRNLWLHTGDAMCQDEGGQFFFVDRLKDAIRRRGENVSSFEVEREINNHPAVLESAVVGVASEHTEQEIKAVVVLRPGVTLDHAELLGFLVERLPYFMVPRYIEVVPELPRTPTEKIRKQELRQQGITPATWDREAAGIRVRRDS